MHAGLYCECFTHLASQVSSACLVGCLPRPPAPRVTSYDPNACLQHFLTCPRALHPAQAHLLLTAPSVNSFCTILHRRSAQSTRHPGVQLRVRAESLVHRECPVSTRPSNLACTLSLDCLLHSFILHHLHPTAPTALMLLHPSLAGGVLLLITEYGADVHPGPI